MSGDLPLIGFTLETMDGGIGPTLTLVLAGVLWLLYLAPSMRRKREFESTEKNTIRIQQALRAAAQTTNAPDEIVAEISHREALIRQRERERAARRRETEIERSARSEFPRTMVSSPRTVKLIITVVALLAIGSAVAFGLAAVWAGTVVSVVVVGFALVTLVLVNGSGSASETRVTQRRSNIQPADESWTPVRPPRVRAARIPDGAGLIVTDETEREVAARERAARIREQAAAASTTPEAAPDSRFTELGYDTGSTAPIDINAALRARRAQ
jgi:ABC-type multidrug transport system fused ATPase/permease subunit